MFGQVAYTITALRSCRCESLLSHNVKPVISIDEALGSLPRSTYYDKHYRQTAALIRARQPYLVRNIFTGFGIFAFVIGVC